MIVNIIHLSARQVAETYPNFIKAEEFRRQHYMEQMCEQRAKHIVWDGVIDSPNFKGISKAHKRIVQDAKDKKMPMVCIAEDDIKFTHPDALKYFFDNIPEKFDYYAGVLYSGNVDDNFKLLNGGSAILSLYIVNESFYDTFLAIDPNWHLDVRIGEVAFKYDIYICNPMVVTQVGGYSYNHRKDCRYDQYERGKVFFQG